jgi:AcrR family transcriptional regulator
MASEAGPGTAPPTRAARAARRPSTPIRLASGELRGLRHVCGLFSGAEETYAALLPFIADGLHVGQRAVHILGPAARATHLERLANAGLDVETALDTGQLEIATWDSTYLRGRRFDSVGMLLFLQKTLAEGRARGFAVTRLIGFMEWTLEPVPGVADVAAYEAELDQYLRGRLDAVVCAYDLSRQAADIIVQVHGAHPIAVVGGKLSPDTGATGSARHRILDAAAYLFSSQGIGATGVDALIDAAGVAKATFYRYFPSKNDLIVAWLSDGRTRWLDRVRRRGEEIAGGPDEAIPAFFDAVAEWLDAEGYRGCPYLNTAVELVDPAHPAHQVIDGFLSEVRSYLAGVLRSSDRAEPEALAGQLHTVLAGATSLSVARRSSAPAREARDAAIRSLRLGTTPEQPTG